MRVTPRIAFAAIFLACASLIALALYLQIGLRLSPEAEHEGADLSIHRIGATPEREGNW